MPGGGVFLAVTLGAPGGPGLCLFLRGGPFRRLVVTAGPPLAPFLPAAALRVEGISPVAVALSSSETGLPPGQGADGGALPWAA